MSHHRNARTDNCTDTIERRSSSLDLDRVGSSLLDEAPGGEDRIAIRRLKAHEWHIGHNQWCARGTARSARSGGRQHDHFVDRDRHGGGVAKHGHGRGVADEDYIHASFGSGLTTRCVVGGDHDDRHARRLLRDEIGQGDLAGSGGRGGGTARASAHADSFAWRASPAEAGAMGSSSRLSIRRVLPMRQAIRTTAGCRGS